MSWVAERRPLLQYLRILEQLCLFFPRSQNRAARFAE
jgi:hypothetical protein